MANTMTDMAPSAMSPTTLAKPIMCTSMPPSLACTSTSLSWILSRTRAFESVRHLDGIDGFAGGVLLEHDGRDQRAREIVGHQAAADAGLEDVFAHLRQRFGRGHELRVDHVAGLDAVLDHFHVAHVGREQRLHAAAVDAVHDQHFVGGLLERVEEPRREHVAVARDQRDQHAVRAAELAWCFTKVCMYSCLSGSCLVNEASMRRPRAATMARTAVSSANTTTMSGAVAEDQLLERRAASSFASLDVMPTGHRLATAPSRGAGCARRPRPRRRRRPRHLAAAPKCPCDRPAA